MLKQISTLELGKSSTYEAEYNPDKLFAIARKPKRDEIGIVDTAPFLGFDLWNHYEVSWLNAKGKPQVAIAEIFYDCNSTNIIESKSMKLYFNTFNNTRFASTDSLIQTIKNDISSRIGGDVMVKLLDVDTTSEISKFTGICIDNLDIECDTYLVNPNLLQTENERTQETLYSHLLKSNCLVTNQPDWASVQITYKGNKINHESLLKYLISFRNHNEFHEQCIERIFMDITRECKPEELTVYGRYTRRGGLDINPLRTSHADKLVLNNLRLLRQ